MRGRLIDILQRQQRAGSPSVSASLIGKIYAERFKSKPVEDSCLAKSSKLSLVTILRGIEGVVEDKTRPSVPCFSVRLRSGTTGRAPGSSPLAAKQVSVASGLSTAPTGATKPASMAFGGGSGAYGTRNTVPAGASPVAAPRGDASLPMRVSEATGPDGSGGVSRVTKAAFQRHPTLALDPALVSRMWRAFLCTIQEHDKDSRFWWDLDSMPSPTFHFP